MEFRIKRKLSSTLSQYSKEELDLSFKFAKLLTSELGDFVKAILLYGSTDAQKNMSRQTKIMVIPDDISYELDSDLVESYRIITEKAIEKISPRISVSTMKLSS